MSAPLFISVDTEFTDGNLTTGQLMAVAFASQATGRTGHWLFPITTDASINTWVWKNQRDMLKACLLKAAETENVAAWLRGQAENLARWLHKDRQQASWSRLGGKTPCKPGAPDVGEIPIVAVTWCGQYDLGFLDRLWSRWGVENPFHHESVDIANIAYGLGFEWDTSAEELTEALGLAPNLNPHDAGYDANHQLGIFEALELRRAAAKALGGAE